MKYVFFTLPFFLLSGSAGQAFGLYFFAITLPIFLNRKHLAAYLQRPAYHAAIGFLLSFSLFPLANITNYLLTHLSYQESFGLKELPSFTMLLRSHLSTAILGSGLFLGLISCLTRYTVGSPSKSVTSSSKALDEPHSSQNTIFLSFTKGLLWASVTLGAYLMFQYLFGFDYREEGYHLAPEKRFTGQSVYRCLGLFSHPLSLAAASLAIFGFYLRLFFSNWTEIKLKANEGHSLRAKWAATKTEIRYYLAIAMLNYVFIALSGGRFALLIASVCLLLAPIVYASRRQVLSKRFGILTLSSALLALALKYSGMLHRFTELSRHFSEGQIHRLKFWQVYGHMISKKPWIGFGQTLLSAGQRDFHYVELGYEDLDQKYNAHNLFLETLANIGVLGTVGILLALVFIYRASEGLCRQGPSKHLHQALTFAFSLNLVNGLTQNTLFDSNVIYIYLGFFWVLLWNSHDYPCRTQS